MVTWGAGKMRDMLSDRESHVSWQLYFEVIGGESNGLDN
jgi:hypothetical protein